jgi:hypothetical protein
MIAESKAEKAENSLKGGNHLGFSAGQIQRNPRLPTSPRQKKECCLKIQLVAAILVVGIHDPVGHGGREANDFSRREGSLFRRTRERRPTGAASSSQS